MKKLMLVMTLALVALSACSKSGNEPVVQNLIQSQESQYQDSIMLHIEAEREDVSVQEVQNPHGITLFAGVTNTLIKSIVINGSGEEDGIIYLYDDVVPAPGQSSSSSNNVVCYVKFQVRGKKVSFRGKIPVNSPVRKVSDLKTRKVAIFVGGELDERYKDTTQPISDRIIYKYTDLALRTKPRMRLDRLKPLFYSIGDDIVVGGRDEKGDLDFRVEMKKLKLYGEFVTFRFRLDGSRAEKNAIVKFNGVSVRGFGTGGFLLNYPTAFYPGATKQYPHFMKYSQDADEYGGRFIPFEDGATYYLKANGQSPFKNPAEDSDLNRLDVSYTLYFPDEHETDGGVRMAFGTKGQKMTPHGTEIFHSGISGDYRNLPNYWGDDPGLDPTDPFGVYRTSPYQKKIKAGNKFHNVLLRLTLRKHN